LSGTIIGRSPNLIVGAFAAVLGAVVVSLAALGVDIPGVVVGAVTTAFGALVALIANTDSIQIAAGATAQARTDAANQNQPPTA
jgi:hypothetical protein